MRYGGLKSAVFFNRDVGMQLINENNLFKVKYSFSYKEQLYYVGFPKKSISEKIFIEFNNNLKDVLSDKIFVEKISKKYDIVIARI